MSTWIYRWSLSNHTRSLIIYKETVTFFTKYKTWYINYVIHYTEIVNFLIFKQNTCPTLQWGLLMPLLMWVRRSNDRKHERGHSSQGGAEGTSLWCSYHRRHPHTLYSGAVCVYVGGRRHCEKGKSKFCNMAAFRRGEEQGLYSGTSTLWHSVGSKMCPTTLVVGLWSDS
jgi:hypothetical protein